MNELFTAVEAGDDVRAAELARSRPELREQRDEDGLIPAMRALYSRGRTLAQGLLRADERLSVFEAAAFGRAARVAELLDAEPALANAFSPDGFTPLHLACFSGGPAVTRLLVDRGADTALLARSSFARVRPLGTAAFSGDVASARLLLEGGADPNGQGDGGFTPLRSAAQNGYDELVQVLLEHGADANASAPDGRTADAFAREAGHAGTADLVARARAA